MLEPNFNIEPYLDSIKKELERNTDKQEFHYMWLGSTNNDLQSPRGHIRIADKKIKVTHIVWFLNTEKWPEKFILHKQECNTGLCIRFEHLYEGDRSTNTNDSVALKTHNMARKTHCPKGHEYYSYGKERRCRICQNEASKRYQQRIKNSAKS